ncbi:MAG: hypothetical protein OEL83_19340 [Desulforhopalus sp.]|nr:hypothetical protein [Desulforhopalus sp.]
MDNYSKTILTIIAILLGTITAKLWQPAPPARNPLDDFVSYAELDRVSKLPEDEKKVESLEIIKKIPVVKVVGTVNVDGRGKLDFVEEAVLKQHVKELREEVIRNNYILQSFQSQQVQGEAISPQPQLPSKK